MSMTRNAFLFVACVLVLFAPDAVVAGNKQPLSVQDAIETTRFMTDWQGNSVAISPDGKRYAAMLIRGDIDRNGVEFEIVAGGLKSIETARPYSVAKLFTRALGPTKYGKGDAAKLSMPAVNFPVWINNDQVAFLWEDANGVHQIAAANVTTKNWRFLTSSKTDVTDFAVGSRGALIYEAKQPYSFEKSNQLFRDGFTVTNADAYSILLDAADGAALKDFTYGVGEWFVKSEASLAAYAKKVRVTNGGTNTYYQSYPALRPTVSPDGRTAIVSGTPQTISGEWRQYDGKTLPEYVHNWANRRTSNARSLQQLFVISIDDASARPVWDAPMNPDVWPTRARWAPDSRSIVIWPVYLPLSSRDPNGVSGNAVAVVDVTSGAYATLPVLSEEARSVTGAQWHDVDTIEFGLQAESITFRKQQGKWTRAETVVKSEPTARIRLELRQDANTPPALYAIDDRTGREEVVLDPNPSLRTHFSLGEVKFIQWQDETGYMWEGRLFLPVNYRSGQRYPLVIQTHAWGRREDFTLYGQASPRPTLGPNSSVYLAQPLANKGIAVLQVGPSPIMERSAEARTVMRGFLSAISYLDSEKIIDRNRVGIMGHSRSGWHAEYALAFSDFPFRAAIVDDNIDSGYFEAAMMSWGSSEPRNGAEPFGAGMKDWLENAPAFNVEHIRSPLLMMVTDSFAGRAAPLAMQWEMFSRLRHLKKPVELYVIPNIERGSHNLQNPAQLLIQQERAMDWWLYWLMDERDPSEAMKEQYAGWDKLRVLRDEDAKRPEPPRLRWTVEPVAAKAAH